MKQIKISIIIPVYNMALYLAECLDSVFKQTIKEKEVICINDGSTDHSLHILEQYQKRYDNLIIINQNNMGAGLARNKGLAAAAGEYVAFMDPDDTYPEEDILESLYCLAKENHVNICGGSLCIENQGEESTDFTGALEGLKFQTDQKIKYRDYQLHYAYVRFIFQLKMLRENHLFFPPFLRYQDPPFMARAMICAGEFYATKKITYRYRIGHKKIKFTEAVILDVCKGFKEILTLSRTEKLSRLHSLAVSEIHESYYSYFFRGILSNNSLIAEMINKINAEMDKQLLEESDSPYQRDPYLSYWEVQRIRTSWDDQIAHAAVHYPKVFIYGAGYLGRCIAKYLQSETTILIDSFVVTKQEENMAELRGLRVQSIDRVSENYQNAIYIVAVSAPNQSVILAEIHLRGIEHYILPEDAHIEFLKQYDRIYDDNVCY